MIAVGTRNAELLQLSPLSCFTVPLSRGPWAGELVEADFVGTTKAGKVLAVRTFLGLGARID